MGIARYGNNAGTIPVYDLMHELHLFHERLQDITVLTDSLNSRYNLSHGQSFTIWLVFNEVHLVQQANSDECVVFKMFNDFLVSYVILKPDLISDQITLKFIVVLFGLCLLEKGKSFLL